LEKPLPSGGQSTPRKLRRRTQHILESRNGSNELQSSAVDLRKRSVEIHKAFISAKLASRLHAPTIESRSCPRFQAAGQCGCAAVMHREQNLSHPPGTNDVQFHRWQFLAERVGWAAMALYLAWALVGGFGDGWISRNRASNDAQTCIVDYERFGRRDAPFKLRVRLQRDDPREQTVLHLNREFLERVNIERVSPTFDRMDGDADGATLVFVLAKSPGEHTIIIEYKPQHIGNLHAAVRLAEEAEVAFDQFIYP
jgi:hypothetical protein